MREVKPKDHSPPDTTNLRVLLDRLRGKKIRWPGIFWDAVECALCDAPGAAELDFKYAPLVPAAKSALLPEHVFPLTLSHVLRLQRPHPLPRRS